VSDLTWEQVRAWRLARHHLAERAPREALLDVVSRLCGVHAQLMGSAELTLCARVDGLEPDAVRRALWEERSLVKTWAMRGTLHLLPAAELGLWHAGLSTYRHYRRPVWLRSFGVTAEQLEALIAGVSEALEGRELTREELARAVAGQTGTPELGDKLRESWGAVLKPAAFQGRLCFAPGEGQKVRFTRPDTWLAGAPGGRPAAAGGDHDPDAALREIARRYLAAHGPATREEFARWWATTPAAAGKLLRALGDDAAEVDVEGAAMWMLRSGAREATRLPPPEGVRLVPAFDQYVVAATRHAEALMPGPFADRVYRPQGWLSAVLLVAGRMEGTWRHERKGRRIAIAFEPFGRLGRAIRAQADAEAERLAAFLGGEPAISWS
jgi:Winged helix DNA-binding domain